VGGRGESVDALSDLAWARAVLPQRGLTRRDEPTEGRISIISTRGEKPGSSAPEFDAFLRGFRVNAPSAWKARTARERDPIGHSSAAVAASSRSHHSLLKTQRSAFFGKAGDAASAANELLSTF
jgi:hypothetical protein